MNPQAKVEKKPRTFQKASYDVFAETCTALEKSPQEICEALGYFKNSWQGWKDANEIPRVAAIACEGLRRRLGISDKIYLIKVTSKDQETTITTFLKALNVEFVNI